MSNHAQVAPVVRVENTEIPVIVYKNKRVITTGLIAKVYSTSAKNIYMNFSRNLSRFEEGKHYFKLEGQELTDFKSVNQKNSPTISGSVRSKANSLILWTERGAARHAKMLDTDQAWNVFDKLEETYFDPAQASALPLLLF